MCRRQNKCISEKLKCVLQKVENMMGKGENAGLPAFSPFPIMFSKGFSYRVIKSPDCVLKCKLHIPVDLPHDKIFHLFVETESIL